MGTASSTKFLINNAGVATEQPALTTSAGAADANKLPALNASGILDDTIVNASTTSAADVIIKAGADGKMDTSFLPSGVGAATESIVASEALSAGSFVNIWDNAGTSNVRLADASTSGKEANGYVLAAVSSGAVATVYFSDTNTQVTSLTVGVQYLSATTPGAATSTAPTGSGQLVQILGKAISATKLVFQPGMPIVLA